MDGILSVLPDGKTHVFMRNAKKIPMGPKGKKGHWRMLVGELDGVKVYVLGERVILTKRDLYL